MRQTLRANVRSFAKRAVIKFAISLARAAISADARNLIYTDIDTSPSSCRPPHRSHSRNCTSTLEKVAAAGLQADRHSSTLAAAGRRRP